MSHLRISKNSMADQGVQTRLTILQNEMADQGVQTHKYNQEMRYIHSEKLLNSFHEQSRFHLDKTFWMGFGRELQLFYVGIAAISSDSGELFKEVIKNLPSSNALFDVGNQLFTPYHESKDPAIRSTQLIAQKKLETLTQSDNVETNILDRVQQMFQNAKDLLAQLHKSFSS